MGSWLSGRYPTSQVPLAEELACVDIRSLDLRTRESDKAAPIAVSFSLADRFWSLSVTQTRVLSGIVRLWLTCPGCSRRARRLFLLDSELLCRVCGGIRYQSQRLAPHERAERRARRLWSKLAPELTFTLSPQAPPRPPRTHRRRHAQLAAAYEAAWQARDTELRGFIRKIRHGC